MWRKLSGIGFSLVGVMGLVLLVVQVVQGGTAVTVLIDAVYYDGYASGEPDEAVQIRNVGTVPVDVGGWQLSDGSSMVVLPAGLTIQPNEAIWLAKDDAAFAASFGFLPDAAVTISSTGTVLALSGSWPGFANSGDEVVLQDSGGTTMDCVVYGSSSGAACAGQWSGTAVQPYTVANVFASEGQVLYRKRVQTTGQLYADTNTAVDWAQDPDDTIDGRKARYPGWDLDRYAAPYVVTETAVITLAIAPDNLYTTVVDQINSAQATIQIETLTFENIAIANALAAAAQRGVTVTVLLEGGPIGGVPDQEKYICQQLDAAGGTCWFMYNDSANRIYDRYKYLHAKFMLIDGERAIILSENFSYNSMPDDDKADGTWGRRGTALVTDAPGVVAHLQDLFAHDFDPANHTDLIQWQAAHPDYGQPSAAFQPVTESGGITYTVRYSQPVSFAGTFMFELVHSPENSLRTVDSLIGMVNRAGAGDVVLVQQLDERPFWGTSSSNAADDPNLRLEAYIAAARRGAVVRLLLDSYYDDNSTTSNAAACTAVTQIAEAEQLDLACKTGNPAGLGIHNKMVLVQANGVGYIHIGSINGTEQSSKGNRELAVQVQSNEAYSYLAEMFWRDWPRELFLPVVMNQYVGLANHILISEVLYDSPGADDAEFVELYNPTGDAVDLSGFSLSDAVVPTNFEDLRRFPSGTTVPAGGTLVVATSATGFYAQNGRYPDFEILETVTAVPNLIDDTSWGDTATYLQLGNSGDEVLLRDENDLVIDAVVYGSGAYDNLVPCPLVSTYNASLQRYPHWRDTDNCPDDFREWPFPSPGVVP
jgi:phosphatidylserine/phosphatidylglycerophosphate/cardiolipin synthase-like enzyme